MNKYKLSEIRNIYGDEAIHLIRRLENRSKGMGRYQSHLRFNLQCKHTETIPKSLKINFKGMDEASRNIIRKAEKALLNVRVSNVLANLDRLGKEIQHLCNKLKDTVTLPIYEWVLGNNQHYRTQAFNSSRDTQRKKYQTLVGRRSSRNNEQVEEEEGTTTEDGEQQTTGEEERRRRDDEEVKSRWVKNISSRELNEHEITLLQKGGGFAISPKNVPTEDYIVATEQACKQIHKGAAAAMRAEVVEHLKNAKLPKSNITKEERDAMHGLQKDETIMVLPADKGKCLVVMDRAEYVTKMEEKLADTTTYQELQSDPTTKVKKLLAGKLKAIHDEGELNYATYMRLYPSATQIPRMYGQPKIHKEGNPLREIVDSNGSIFKNIDKHIANIIKPLAGNTEYHVRNTKHFVDSVKDIHVADNEILVSYDVTALYPSVPQDEAIELIYQKLKADPTLKDRTKMTAEHIIDLFKLFVHNMYFVFNNKLYKQLNGLAIGAATSGFAADIFMEDLELRAINTYIEPPTLWKRFVDDTISKLLKEHVNGFLTHLNSLHPRIKFTTETQTNNKIAFFGH